MLVGHPPVGLAGSLCPPTGRHPVVASHKWKRWLWGWNATVDGTRAGAPLPAGAYTLTIGGANVSVTVT